MSTKRKTSRHPAAPPPPEDIAQRSLNAKPLPRRPDSPEPPARGLPHPDHGPPELLPREEDGRVSPYFYCSKEEVAGFGLEPPPRRKRHDGWTAERMASFLRTLAATGSVSEAARAVHCSRQSAYTLYNAPGADAFRQAWDQALNNAVNLLVSTAYDRAINGQEEIVYHRGARVGTRWRYDNRLLMSLIRARDPLRFAPLHELEGWQRIRAVEPHQPLEPALERLAAAERAWGDQPPAESQSGLADDGVQLSSLSTFETAAGLTRQADIRTGAAPVGKAIAPSGACGIIRDPT